MYVISQNQMLVCADHTESAALHENVQRNDAVGQGVQTEVEDQGQGTGQGDLVQGKGNEVVHVRGRRRILRTSQSVDVQGQQTETRTILKGKLFFMSAKSYIRDRLCVI